MTSGWNTWNNIREKSLEDLRKDTLWKFLAKNQEDFLEGLLEESLEWNSKFYLTKHNHFSICNLLCQFVPLTDNIGHFWNSLGRRLGKCILKSMLRVFLFFRKQCYDSLRYFLESREDWSTSDLCVQLTTMLDVKDTNTHLFCRVLNTDTASPHAI